jgi:hypothetical protein
MQDEKTNEDESKPVTEELNFEKADYTFIPNGIHQYHQQGYYLICRSCDLVHAVFIGSEKIMVGQSEDGSPILKTRKELNMD